MKEVTLYAYKGCLAVFGSLLKNDEMPLWIREGDLLFQKLLRQSCDEKGLFYKSSRTYSCWFDSDAWQYLEIKAVKVAKIESQASSSTFDLTYKIMNVDEIEEICMAQHFEVLQLSEYKSGGTHTPFKSNAITPELKVEHVVVEKNTGGASTSAAAFK
jgi:hypothetical protein